MPISHEINPNMNPVYEIVNTGPTACVNHFSSRVHVSLHYDIVSITNPIPTKSGILILERPIGLLA